MNLAIEYKATKSLIPYINNSRTHDDSQVQQIAASIKEFGFTNPVLVDEEDGIIAGHGRLMAATLLKLDEVPTITLSGLTEAQRKAYVIADNQLALNAGWDLDSLKIEIETLNELDFDTEILGFDDDFLNGLMEEEPGEGLTDEDVVPEAPESPVSVLGDIWQLGNHRLMCGDSTSIDAVEMLMDGQKPDLIHTDPPYGIGYGGSMKLGTEKFGWKQHSGGWDEERPPREFFDLALATCKNAIIWGGNYFSDYLRTTMGWLVWDKGQRGFSLADGEMAWTSFNNAMRIKEYARAKANKEERFHATQKPLEIIEWAFEYADRHCDVKPQTVLDFFGGSGSTLIACEKTKRNCQMMELDPKYIDVIITRWQDFVGKEAVHIESGKTFAEMSEGR